MRSFINRLRCQLSVLAFLVLIAGLQACTPWPGPATGGLAERHPTEWPPLITLEHRYNGAIRAGAERWTAGPIVDARLLLTRAQREHEGGLIDDADLTLAKADVMLTFIERELSRHRTRARHEPGS